MRQPGWSGRAVALPERLQELSSQQHKGFLKLRSQAPLLRPATHAAVARDVARRLPAQARGLPQALTH
eukprot:15451959-Alexandrium_andersonii.AAC.1